MNQVLAFMRRSGDASEPSGHAEPLALFIKETWAVERLLSVYITHHAATSAELPGHVQLSQSEGSPRGLQRKQLVHTLMLFASHHTSTLMRSHILLFLTTLKNLLCLHPRPSPLSRRSKGHISSDWQQQQLRLSGVRTAADSRWTQHMNQHPPFHNLHQNLKQRSRITKQECWWSDRS